MSTIHAPRSDTMADELRKPRFQVSIGVMMLVVAVAAVYLVNARIILDFIENYAP